jgi:hypothetical protein
MTLYVKATDGSEWLGTGFLAFRNGLAVTAWHVVQGAKQVTAVFSNGEQCEVTGLVDCDVNADVAIVRLKETGRPLLHLHAADPPIGARAYTLGAPKGYGFTFSDGIVSQIRKTQGCKEYQFTCPAWHGDSGGPLLLSDGSVVGTIERGDPEAQNVNFARSAFYVLALDSTQPAESWDQVSAKEPADNTVDSAIADAFISYADGLTLFRIACIRLLNHHPNDIVNKQYYRITLSEADAIDNLKGLQVSDNDHAAIIVDLAGRLTKLNSMLSMMVTAARSDAIQGWANPDTQDAYDTAFALYEMLTDTPPIPEWTAWEKASYCKGRFTPAQLFALAPETDTGYTLGGEAFFATPARIEAIDPKMLAYDIGLRDGDTILSVDDTPANGLLDLKTAVKQHAGDKIKIMVERGGEQMELDPDIPSELPTDAFNYERPAPVLALLPPRQPAPGPALAPDQQHAPIIIIEPRPRHRSSSRHRGNSRHRRTRHSF